MAHAYDELHDGSGATVQRGHLLAAAAHILKADELDAAVRWADALIRVTGAREQTGLSSFWSDLRILLMTERGRRFYVADREIRDLERLAEA